MMNTIKGMLIAALLSVCSTVQAEKASDAIMEARCAQWADSVDITQYHLKRASATLSRMNISYEQGVANGMVISSAAILGVSMSVTKMNNYNYNCAHPKTLD